MSSALGSLLPLAILFCDRSGYKFLGGSPIGSGATAKVYPLRPNADGPVVLKIIALSRELLEERYTAKRAAILVALEHELGLQSALVHPHIMPVLACELSWSGAVAFVIMPGGTPLADILYRTRVSAIRKQSRVIGASRCLPPSVALAFLRKLTGALAYMHAHGVAHLDITPGNIVVRCLGEAGTLEPVIIDFSLAAFVTKTPRVITEAALSVTTHHMRAPSLYWRRARCAAYGEVASGVTPLAPAELRDALLPALDMWSLGCVFYEMIFGYPPVATGRHASALENLVTLAGSVPPAPSIVATFPPEVLKSLSLSDSPEDTFHLRVLSLSLQQKQLEPILTKLFTSLLDWDDASRITAPALLDYLQTLPPDILPELILEKDYKLIAPSL